MSPLRWEGDDADPIADMFAALEAIRAVREVARARLEADAHQYRLSQARALIRAAVAGGQLPPEALDGLDA